MSKSYNVAVVGYGLSAKIFHIPFILPIPDLNLYGIVQRNPKPDDDCSNDHPGVKSYRSIDEVYTDPAVDVVVLTTVPETHFEMTKASLEAGKHCVVEKPFVPTSAEAQELAAVAHKTGKKLAVYQNRRWDSDYQTLRQVLEAGSLGEIAEFETHFDRHRPDPPPDSWKTQGAPATGAAYDLGVHLLDQVYHSFGMPQTVTGFVGNQRRGVQGGSPDSCTVLLQYETGMLVTAKAGVVSPEPEQLRYWVRGTKGSFRKNHLDVQEDQLKAGLRPGDSGYGIEPEGHYATLARVGEKGLEVSRLPTVMPPPTYVEFYRRFVGALNGEGEVPVRAEEAAAVLRIIEAAVESSRSGRRVAL
ncbi:hypothetical protein MBLNU230_g0253t1 [Neophaeotheca triangularis]